MYAGGVTTRRALRPGIEETCIQPCCHASCATSCLKCDLHSCEIQNRRFRWFGDPRWTASKSAFVSPLYWISKTKLCPVPLDMEIFPCCQSIRSVGFHGLDQSRRHFQMLYQTWHMGGQKLFHLAVPDQLGSICRSLVVHNCMNHRTHLFLAAIGSSSSFSNATHVFSVDFTDLFSDPDFTSFKSARNPVGQCFFGNRLMLSQNSLTISSRLSNSI